MRGENAATDRLLASGPWRRGLSPEGVVAVDRPVVAGGWLVASAPVLVSGVSTEIGYGFLELIRRHSEDLVGRWDRKRGVDRPQGKIVTRFVCDATDMENQGTDVVYHGKDATHMIRRK